MTEGAPAAVDDKIAGPFSDDLDRSQSTGEYL